MGMHRIGEGTMGYRLLASLMLLAVAFAAHAGGQGPKAVRENIEASMLVTGTIHVDEAGKVTGYAIDRSDEVPAEVRRLLEQAVPQWVFEPVLHQGAPAAVETSMRGRVAANKGDGGSVVLRVVAANFGDFAPGEFPSSDEPRPPGYPREALRQGVAGTVFLLAKIGRDGRVEDVIAEQVNLRYVAGENAMERWRRLLAKVSMSAAKRWRFKIPTTGDAVDDAFWSVRIPVDFDLGDSGSPPYGAWRSYIPGPRTTAWWVEGDTASGADAYLAGGIYPVGMGPKLLTPLGGKG